MKNHSCMISIFYITNLFSQNSLNLCFRSINIILLKDMNNITTFYSDGKSFSTMLYKVMKAMSHISLAVCFIVTDYSLIFLCLH